MEIGRSLGMTIHRLWESNANNEAKALERLSSGLKINRASDDAAGLQISDRLTSQVRGTNQAIRNAQDGIDLLRVADGSFGSTMDVLQRMRQLCVQGANGTYTAADRAAIQTELEALKAQIDSTAYGSQFNGLNLLVNQDKTYASSPLAYQYDATQSMGAWSVPNTSSAQTQITGGGGSFAGVTQANLAGVLAQLPTLVEGARRIAEGQLMNSGIDQSTYVSLTNQPLQVYFIIDPANPSRFTQSNPDSITLNLYSFFGSAIPPANPQITLQQAMTQAMGYTLTQREDTRNGLGDVNAFITPSGVDDGLALIFQQAAGSSYLGYGKPAVFQFDTVSSALDGRQKSAWFSQYMVQNYGQAALDQITRLVVANNTGSKASITAQVDAYLLSVTGQASKTALETAINTWIAAQPGPTPLTPLSGLSNTTDTTAHALDTGLTLQIGANFGDTLTAKLFAGGVGNLDFVAMASVADNLTAGESLSTIDKAIAIVSNARAQLGATENRLEHTISRLSTYEEEAMASNSRLRDTDMATEASNLARSQILSKASGASLVRLHRIEQEHTGQLLSGLPPH